MQPRYQPSNIQVIGQSAPSDVPVQFSLLYQLRHTACSITARNSTSPLRLSGGSSSSGNRGDGVPGYTTPPRHTLNLGRGSDAAPTTSNSSASNHRQVPNSQSSPATWSPNPTRRGNTAHAAEYTGATNTASIAAATTVPLLSTMDKRELSKVIVRDAVYARVLDLVPGRQHVQVAVWTLSPHIIQIDGAVAVCALPRDSAGLSAGPLAGCSSWSIGERSGPATSASMPATQDVRRVLQERLREIAFDSSLFATLLKPYLGEVGCQGDVVRATVDGA